VSKKLFSRLWILTGLVALVLLIVTVSLASRALVLPRTISQADQTVTVYLTGGGRLFQLYEEPDRLARVRSVLEYGTAVDVVDSTEDRDQLWYYVEVEEKKGWIPAESVSLEPPE
jgi:SH3-like domain-containing protein